MLIDSLITPPTPPTASKTADPIKTNNAKFEVKKIKKSDYSHSDIISLEKANIKIATEQEETLSLISKSKCFLGKDENKICDNNSKAALSVCLKRKANQVTNSNNNALLDCIKSIKSFDDIAIDFSILQCQDCNIPSEFINKEQYCSCFLISLYKNLILNVKETSAKLDTEKIINIKLIGSQDTSAKQEEGKESDYKQQLGPIYIKVVSKIPDKVKKDANMNDLWALCSSAQKPICYARSLWYTFSSQQMLQVLIIGGKKLSSAEVQSISSAFIVLNLSTYITSIESLIKFKHSENCESTIQLCRILHIKENTIPPNPNEETAFLNANDMLNLCKKKAQTYLLNSDQRV